MTDKPPPSAYRGPNPVLDPDWHATLVARAPEFARSAGIPVSMLWEPASAYCSAEEVEYLRTVYATDKAGLLWVGRPEPGTASVLRRMQAMAAVCLRNYHDARVMVLSDVLDGLKEGEVPAVRFLFVPDFFTAKTQVRDWVASAMLSLLLRREADGRQTFLYAFDDQALASAYGDAMIEHLHEGYARVVL